MSDLFIRPAMPPLNRGALLAGLMEGMFVLQSMQTFHFAAQHAVQRGEPSCNGFLIGLSRCL